MKAKEKALLVAEKVHDGQSYDIFPYIYHIKEVVRVAEDLGYDESIVVACYLHDSMEDGNLSYNDILQAFGQEVAEIVYAVTDELGRNRLERKYKTYPKIKGNWKATVVKICDRIANISHSKEFTPKLFEMYKKEHEDFCRNLMSADHPHTETNRAWERLNKLFKENEII
jgi:(p)ppGpp synthase/HD superfamily hydrolase